MFTLVDLISQSNTITASSGTADPTTKKRMKPPLQRTFKSVHFLESLSNTITTSGTADPTTKKREKPSSQTLSSSSSSSPSSTFKHVHACRSHLTIKYNHSLIRYCRSYDEEEDETTITTYVQKRALSRKLIKHDHNLRYCRSYEYEEGETFISGIILEST